ncbi:acyltransferase [Winogradskyella ludwigii]|uniref:acyltransferase n=1 Tax=Winogradskyella ludwigii TaxID=2686076 RepID=UPI0015C6A00B|nr:acyltransferase [Winogradskyella ludwigii]
MSKSYYGPSQFGKIYFKIKQKRLWLKLYILKLRGLQIGRDNTIGKIYANWPNRLIIGDNCDIQDNISFRIVHPFKESNYIKLGDHIFIGDSCEFNCSSKIIIENDCLIASNTTFVDTGHAYKRDKKIKDQAVLNTQIIIKEDVWIGTSCNILSGVTIGKGAVIAAGAVVNKDVPEYEVWGGVPAKFIKKRM